MRGIIENKGGMSGLAKVLIVIAIVIFIIIFVPRIYNYILYVSNPTDLNADNIEYVLSNIDNPIYENYTKSSAIIEVIKQGEFDEKDLNVLVEKGYITQEEKNEIILDSGLWYVIKFKIVEKSSSRFWRSIGWALGFNTWQGEPISAYPRINLDKFDVGEFLLFGIFIGIGIGLIIYLLVVLADKSAIIKGLVYGFTGISITGSRFKVKYIAIGILFGFIFYFFIFSGTVQIPYLYNSCDEGFSSLCWVGDGFSYLAFALYVFAWTLIYMLIIYINIGWFQVFPNYFARHTELNNFVDKSLKYIKNISIVMILYVILMGVPIANQILYFVTLEFWGIHWIIRGFILATAIYFSPLFWKKYINYARSKAAYKEELEKQAAIEIAKARLKG